MCPCPSGHWKAMSESQTLLLGFIAGVTILIGLPLGRVRKVKPGTRQFLNALAIGILIFLIWDVLVHAFEPVDVALGKLHDGSGGVGPVTVLVIGFALHNGTEGFGIVAPLAAENDRPSWGFLLLMGLIGGGPTFVGTAVGRQFTSDAMSVIFLTLAAGSILYVVIQLFGVAYKNGRKELIYWGVLLGLCAGFVTDMVVTAGGA